jgi:glycosyltransferase involved in cell wall biosynthesis
MARVLFISYDGMAEPLGQSQVISYLEKLADANQIHVISFEKPIDINDPVRMQVPKQRFAAKGIEWTPMRYHSRPSALATSWDIFRGQIVSLWLAWRIKADIIHVRSYVPALIALPAKSISGAKLVFDIRGFWADERVDGGIWPRDSMIFRITKRLEQLFFNSADCVVTLTHASVPIINNFNFWKKNIPPIAVIPTCADLKNFSPSPLKLMSEPFIFGYVGSFGTWYLLDETMSLFKAISAVRPDARMLVVNRTEHKAILESAHRVGVPIESIELFLAAHSEVPMLIRRMHFASALIRPCYSKVSSAPTKLAEYLGCGVPCVGNAGVGDIESILEGRGTGLVLRAYDEIALSEAARLIVSMAFEPSLAQRCRGVAEELFSLDIGISAYQRIYSDLTTESVVHK